MGPIKKIFMGLHQNEVHSTQLLETQYSKYILHHHYNSVLNPYFYYFCSPVAYISYPLLYFFLFICSLHFSPFIVFFCSTVAYISYLFRDISDREDNTVLIKRLLGKWKKASGVNSIKYFREHLPLGIINFWMSL